MIWGKLLLFCTCSLVKQMISFVMEENGPFCVAIKDVKMQAGTMSVGWTRFVLEEIHLVASDGSTAKSSEAGESGRI